MELGQDDIRTLVEESREGNRESFQKLYDHLVSRVYAYSLYRTQSSDEALDLTQEVFIELWKALPRFTFHTKEQFYAYVFVIARRRLSNLYGKKGRTDVSFDEDSMGMDTPHTEESLEVLGALSSLDEETREIIVLHHWSRFTFKEIAALVHLSESAVRVRHHRAMKTLRTYLTKK